MEHYRQGDVLILKTDSIPAGAKKETKCILAHGEVTGHTHRFERGAQLFTAQINEQALERFVQIKVEVAQLVHEEHSTIAVPEGEYRVIIQKEYEPGSLRDVID